MSKKTLQCGTCHGELPKHEAQFVDEETFSFLSQWPKGIAMGTYCFPCFDSHVKPELDIYNHKMELAKNINVFYLTQSKESHFVRRIEKPIQVKDVLDRDEALLRLAFLAVEANKNTIVDVEFSSVKIKNGRWQTSRWSARAIPAQLTESDMRRRIMNNPN